MNIEKLLRILNIKYKIRTRGCGGVVYVVKCPYCDSYSHKHKHKNWSGALLESNNKLRYSCWRGCNSSIFQVLQDLSGADIEDVKEALSLSSSEYRKELKLDETKHVFELPEDIGLTQKYRDYLSYRGVNAEYVTEKYKLRFTPPFYTYKGMNMSNCICFPIYNMKNRPVSFTARTISPTAVIRYLFPKACDELEAGKDIGWGYNGLENRDMVCIVEGVFDALKLDSVGIPAIACLGINYSTGFVTNVIKSGIKSACVIFDPEPQARKQQTKLINELSLMIPVTTIQYPYNKDLGDCNYGELQEIKKLIEDKRKEL